MLSSGSRTVAQQLEADADKAVRVAGGGPSVSLCDPAIPIQDMEMSWYQCQQSVPGQGHSPDSESWDNRPINWAR